MAKYNRTALVHKYVISEHQLDMRDISHRKVSGAKVLESGVTRPCWGKYGEGDEKENYSNR